MHKIVCFIFMFALAFADDDEDTCKITRKNLPETKLRDHLFCEYDMYNLRPVKDAKNITLLSVKLLVKYVEYDETTATLSVNSWIPLSWRDEHLQWNPNEFSGIKQIHITDTDVWIPDLSIYNRADEDGDAKIMSDVSCILLNTGYLVCVPTARLEALCIPDLAKFPYDTQNCTIRLGSWIHSGEELNLRFASPAFSLADMDQNGQWDVLAVETQRNSGKYKCCPNNTYPSLEYRFIIKRHAGIHTATIVIPALVLLIITLLSLWINPNSSDRLHICYVNLISQFLYLQYVSWMVPTHGATVPFLICYSRDSLLLCSFILVLTVILRNLITGSEVAPKWVSIVVSYITSCRVGEIVLLNDYSIKGVAVMKGQDDADNIVNNQGNNNTECKDWAIFAKILDRMCFIVFSLIYIVMFLSYAP